MKNSSRLSRLASVVKSSITGFVMGFFSRLRLLVLLAWCLVCQLVLSLFLLLYTVVVGVRALMGFGMKPTSLTPSSKSDTSEENPSNISSELMMSHQKSILKYRQLCNHLSIQRYRKHVISPTTTEPRKK